MSSAWKNLAWKTNSWVGMNAGPPNAWMGSSSTIYGTNLGTGGSASSLGLNSRYLQGYSGAVNRLGGQTPNSTKKGGVS